MLSFISEEYYKDIKGYDIEIINSNLKGCVNKNRIRLIKEHIVFDLEEAYIDFLNNNIAVVFKIKKEEEKLINLYYAYEVVNQNLAKEIYEKYNLKATIIGKVVGKSEKDIFIMCNDGYGIYILDDDENIKKISNSFIDLFTKGIGLDNL